MSSKKTPSVHRTFVMLTPELKAAVQAEPGANMNDTIVGMLAARFGVAFKPTGKAPTRAAADSMGTVLRMPWQLYVKLRRECERTIPPRPLQTVILGELERAYGKEVAA